METVDFLASLEVHGGHGAPWICMDSLDLWRSFRQDCHACPDCTCCFHDVACLVGAWRGFHGISSRILAENVNQEASRAACCLLLDVNIGGDFMGFRAESSYWGGF